MKMLIYSESGKLLGSKKLKKRKFRRYTLSGVVEVPRDDTDPWMHRKYPDELEGWVMKKKYHNTGENPFRGARIGQVKKVKKEKRDKVVGVYIPSIPGVTIAKKAKKVRGKVIVKTYGKIIWKGKKHKKFVKRVKTNKG